MQSEYDTEGKHVFQLSDEAFGAFTTLMGLVYSIILGQSYQYYFDRQGAIQDASFKEIANIHRCKMGHSVFTSPITHDDDDHHVKHVCAGNGRGSQSSH